MMIILEENSRSIYTGQIIEGKLLGTKGESECFDCGVKGELCSVWCEVGIVLRVVAMLKGG
jgi:hypothetical protein